MTSPSNGHASRLSDEAKRKYGAVMRTKCNYIFIMGRNYRGLITFFLGSPQAPRTSKKETKRKQRLLFWRFYYATLGVFQSRRMDGGLHRPFFLKNSYLLFSTVKKTLGDSKQHNGCSIQSFSNPYSLHEHQEFPQIKS